MYIRNSIKDIDNKNKGNVKFWVAKTITLRLFNARNVWSVLTKNKQSETKQKTKQKTKQNNNKTKNAQKIPPKNKTKKKTKQTNKQDA